MKKLNFLLLVLFFSLNLYGFNIDSVDPEKSINYKGSILTYENMQNPEWLLNQIKNVNAYILKHPASEQAYKVRGYLLQLLYENTAGPVGKVKVADLGIKYSVIGLKRLPDSNVLHFWYTTFIAEKYLYLGLQMLKELPVIIRALTDVVNKDPRCCLGVPSMILGRYYYKIPPFPVSLGDYKQSEKYLKLAIRVNPDMIPFYLFLAETLNAMGKKSEALSVLEKAKDVKSKTWMELYMNTKYMRGIDILEKAIKNNEWDTSRDIYVLINKISH